jgi:lipopolysaccharide/colanic/teichoic acid biosynthesis glycosyltransferase
MFGFVKSDKTHIYLGGEIFKIKQKKKRIILIVFAILGFVLLNLILYYLTSV